MKIRKRWLFYLLSFTWGLPMTIIGCIASLVLLALGHKPQMWGYCWYFTIGKNWGGLELGPCFITDRVNRYHTKCHEHGHGIQNCYFGPLMPFLVCIPSEIRYWYRELRYYRRYKVPPTKYDSIWFEGQASEVGTEHISYLKNL